jgi:hypothetical protein
MCEVDASYTRRGERRDTGMFFTSRVTSTDW